MNYWIVNSIKLFFLIKFNFKIKLLIKVIDYSLVLYFISIYLFPIFQFKLFTFFFNVFFFESVLILKSIVQTSTTKTNSFFFFTNSRISADETIDKRPIKNSEIVINFIYNRLNREYFCIFVKSAFRARITETFVKSIFLFSYTFGN